MILWLSCFNLAFEVYFVEGNKYIGVEYDKMIKWIVKVVKLIASHLFYLILIYYLSCITFQRVATGL